MRENVSDYNYRDIDSTKLNINYVNHEYSHLDSYKVICGQFGNMFMRKISGALFIKDIKYNLNKQRKLMA